MVKYTKDVLEKAAKNSISIAEVLRKIGVTYESGGLHAHISKRLKKFGIDTSHFLGQGHNKGREARNKLSPKEVFVRRISGRRQRREILKRVLLESGVDYKCGKCGRGGRWCGEELTLPIDHINGDFLDDRKKNLRFLCPNCHSQTETFSRRGGEIGRRSGFRGRRS